MTEILLHRFWSHVSNKADHKAVLVPNPDAGKREYYPTAVPYGGVGATAYREEGPFKELTWSDVGAITAEIMNQLMQLGVKRGDRVAILSWNTPEWVWTDIAIQSLGAVTVPIYPNSAADQVNFILGNCQSQLLIGDSTAQTSKVAAIAGAQTRLFSDLVKDSEVHKVRVRHEKPAEDSDVFELSVSPMAANILGQMKTSHSKAVFVEATSGGATVGIKPDDLCTIIYTSGSTGVPKGVPLTHDAIAASCTALYGHGFDFNESDLYLSYLPLAHVYERVNGQFICLWQAVPTVFCKVEEVNKYLTKAHPTIMLGVPAVWRKIKDKMQSEIDKAQGFKAKLIKWAFATKKGSLSHWFADLLVFKNVRKALGGRLRIMGSGGAPISPEVLAFFQSVGMDIIQGYGLTETCGGITANKPGDIVLGTVGPGIEGVEIRLVPEPGDTSGAGVIMLRGRPLTKGYWNLPEENAKAFVDGWFNTGDIGKFDAKGNLMITGRKKRLLKTDGGKYVAPEKVEKAFDDQAIVQAIVPVGDAQPFIGALIFVNAITGREILKAKGVEIPAGDAEAQHRFIVNHEAVVNAVKEAVKAANTKLEQWETVKKIELIEEEATVANGLMTATLKIRTEEAIKRYEDRVTKIYTKPGK